LTREDWLTKIGTYIFARGGNVSGYRLPIILAGVTICGSLLTSPVRAFATETTGFSAFPTVLRATALSVPNPPSLSPYSPAAVPSQAQDSAKTEPLREQGEIPVFSRVLAGKSPFVPAEGISGDLPSVVDVEIPLAASADPPVGTVPHLIVLRDEKEADLVLSPRDIDGHLAGDIEGELVVELDAGFFANASEEIEKGEDGSYAGLTTRIDKFIRYFQNKGRDRFEVWLSRSGKYSYMMRNILAKYGMPGDLVYLALIESGFSPMAYSVARAAGPWQFIARTGRRYGLRVDWWADERRDYEKSTHAAASYLKDLYGMFDSWPLAAAAYNAGEGKIMRAVSRYKTEDYAKLIRYRYLPRETKDYVPKMLAALTIAKDPEKYGFGDVLYEDPLEFDKVSVPGGIDLAALGGILDVPLETMKELNPELKRFCTPPNVEGYEIRLPSGFASVAEERMEEIRKEAQVTFLLHKVGKKDTLVSLANEYETPVSILKEMNGLRSNSLRRASRLIIPVTGFSGEEAAPGTKVSPDMLRMAHLRVDEGYRRGQRIRVRRGDTLWKIARRSGVSVKSLARANRMKTTGILRAGATIRIPGAVSRSGKGSRHVVRRGESLWSIARAHGVTVNQLARRNNMTPRESLRSGRVLRIPTES
jgi:membrane-bound lytic murein transglycosylase D